MWRNMGNKKKVPYNDPVMLKTYFSVIDKTGAVCKDFRKEIYQLIDTPMPVFVHYLGISNAETVQMLIPGPHGNVRDKANSASYSKTLPSTLIQLRKDVATKNPSSIYKESAKTGGLRNCQQARNMRYVKSNFYLY